MEDRTFMAQRGIVRRVKSSLVSGGPGDQETELTGDWLSRTSVVVLAIASMILLYATTSGDRGDALFEGFFLPAFFVIFFWKRRLDALSAALVLLLLVIHVKVIQIVLPLLPYDQVAPYTAVRKTDRDTALFLVWGSEGLLVVFPFFLWYEWRTLMSEK